MVRAAAKNHPSVAIVTSPARYADVLAAVAAGGFTLAERQRLAAEAFQHTATYDVAVASWMSSVLTDTSEGTGFPSWTGATWDKAAVLRYGENPHQPAALYRHWQRRPRRRRAAARQGDVLQQLRRHRRGPAGGVRLRPSPAVAIIKHANPCGIAVGADVAEAHRKAHACDPTVGVRRRDRGQPAGLGGDGRAGRRDLHRGDRRAGVRRRRGGGPRQGKKNIRILVCPPDEHPDPVEFRGISGGVLLQRVDHVDAEGDDPSTWTLATGEAAPDDVLADLAFAWKACRAVKSNAILLAKDGASVGIGMGQVNRVDSCRLAVARAGDRAKGSVAASDAFFPFEDGPQILIDAGVRAIVQPGGSVRDELTVEAAKAAGVTMYFTGTRHFFH